MLGFFVTLHTLASVIQQIHTIVRWRDIKIEQYQKLVANVGDPELNITGLSTGMDLVLFYIRQSPTPRFPGPFNPQQSIIATMSSPCWSSSGTPTACSFAATN
jgi:hypothetical protein